MKSFRVFPAPVQSAPRTWNPGTPFVVVGLLGGPLPVVQSFCEQRKAFGNISNGEVEAYIDGDAGVLYLHTPTTTGAEETPEMLLAHLYVFLASHAVVIFDACSGDWIRRFRMLQELKRGVSKTPAAPWLVFSLPSDPVAFQEIVATLSEYRSLNDPKQRLFRLLEAPGTMQGILIAVGGSIQPRALSLGPLVSKRDLLELSASILATSNPSFRDQQEPSSATALFAPRNHRRKVINVSNSTNGRSVIDEFLARRSVGACCCGQRQLNLRDLFDPALASCCASVSISLPLAAPNWTLSRLPPGTPLGPGFSGDPSPLLTHRGVSFGIEYECAAGHRFFLSENMAKIVLRVKNVDRVITSDVPVFTKCLACKESADGASIGQLARLYVCCQKAIRAIVEPVIRFAKGGKNGAPVYTFKSPCGPILLNCSSCCYVLRLPRVYMSSDGPLMQKDVNSPYYATMEPWLKL